MMKFILLQEDGTGKKRKIPPIHRKWFTLTQLLDLFYRKEIELLTAMISIILVTKRPLLYRQTKFWALCSFINLPIEERASRFNISNDRIDQELDNLYNHDKLESKSIFNNKDGNQDSNDDENDNDNKSSDIETETDSKLLTNQIKDVIKRHSNIFQKMEEDEIKELEIANKTKTKSFLFNKENINKNNKNQRGSAIKYAIITPTKRIKEILQTDHVISPVRRSLRIAQKSQLFFSDHSELLEKNQKRQSDHDQNNNHDRGNGNETESEKGNKKGNENETDHILPSPSSKKLLYDSFVQASRTDKNGNYGYFPNKNLQNLQ